MKTKLKGLKKVILRSGLFLSTLLGTLALASQVNAEQFKYVDQNNQEQTTEISSTTTFGQILGESSANFYVISDGDGEQTLDARTITLDKNDRISDYLEPREIFKIMDQEQYEAIKNTKTLTFRYQDFNHQDYSIELEPNATFEDVLASLPETLREAKIYDYAKYLERTGHDLHLIASLWDSPMAPAPDKTIKHYLEVSNSCDRTIISMTDAIHYGATEEDAIPKHTFMLLTDEEKEQLEQQDDDLRATLEEVQRRVQQQEQEMQRQMQLADEFQRTPHNTDEIAVPLGPGDELRPQRRVERIVDRIVDRGELVPPAIPDPFKSKEVINKSQPPVKLKPIHLTDAYFNNLVDRLLVLDATQENHLREMLDNLFKPVFLHYCDGHEHAIVPPSVYALGIRYGQSDQFPDSNNPSKTTRYSNDSGYSRRFYHLKRHDQEEFIAILEKAWEIFNHEKEEAYQQYPQLRAKVAENTKNCGEYQKIVQAAIELDLENQQLAPEDQKKINYENEVLKIMKNSTNFNHHFDSTSDDITYAGTNCQNRLMGVFREIKDSLSEAVQTDDDQQNQLNQFQIAYALLLKEARARVIRSCCAGRSQNVEAEVKINIENILNPLLFSYEVPVITGNEDYYANRSNVLTRFSSNIFNIEAIQEVTNQYFSFEDLRRNVIEKFNDKFKFNLRELKNKLHLNLADDQLREFVVNLTSDPQEFVRMEQFINGSARLSLDDLLTFGDCNLRGALFAFLLGHSPIAYRYDYDHDQDERNQIPQNGNDIVVTSKTVDQLARIQVDDPQHAGRKEWIKIPTGKRIERRTRQLRPGISLRKVGMYYESIVLYLAIMDSVENPDDAI